jgi:hypothetical protein
MTQSNLFGQVFVLSIGLASEVVRGSVPDWGQSAGKGLAAHSALSSFD